MQLTIVTSKNCSDTQTGLRGIQNKYIKNAITIIGDRYEYEINFLLQATHWEIPFLEVPIETIYLNDNKESHFRPIHDSARIYGVIFSYWFNVLFSEGKNKYIGRFLI